MRLPIGHDQIASVFRGIAYSAGSIGSDNVSRFVSDLNLAVTAKAARDFVWIRGSS